MEEKNLITENELIEEIKNNTILRDDIEALDDSDEAGEQFDRKLVIDKVDPTIESLYMKFTRQKLILQPDYQRKYVMKPQVASRLIESILLDIPLPIVYFAEEEDGSWSVIDGQQRLTSIISFVQGKNLYDDKPFKLTSLNVMTELNRKSFSDLSNEQQEKILNTAIRSFVIKKESNDDIKFEIFERLNTGSTPLNEDEIRNTVYRGKYMNLLKELEGNELFDKIVNKPNFKNRMLYKGMILRFFAFYEKTYLNYKPSMKQFCNKHIKRFRNMDDEQISEYRQIFKDTISSIYSVFGENAFRRMMKEEGTNNYIWAKTRINMALYDIQMYSFSRYDKEQLIRHADEIRDRMYDLMINNPDFINAIEFKTSNTDMVNRRFRMWLDIMEDIMKQDIETDNPRCFPDSIKSQLYNEDPTCKLCGQRILNYDDAHVDHIIPYSKGGLTVLENAQIAHRYCNQHKSNNE
ncbi:uncharacterized protein BN809_00589 [Clostridium sp. CAG:914]|nr:uncharacterized protein BN809_00589 [Clostridium sp. CAG:914]